MKALKKFLVGVCISSMLVAPTSIFAEEVNIDQPQFTVTLETGETIELVPVYENGIMPCVIDTSGVSIGNNETIYFINRDTGKPFVFAAQQIVTMTVNFTTKFDVDMGWADLNNNIIGYSEFWSTVPSKRTYQFKNTIRGRTCRPFIKSYSADTVQINRMEVNTNW